MWEVCTILAKLVPSGDDSGSHVGKTSLIQRSVSNHLRKLLVVPVLTSRHSHVKPTSSRIETTVLRRPIRNHEALEVELAFEHPIDSLAVLAGISVVDPVITAHYATDPGMNRILEWPQVELVHRPIIDI